MIVNVLYDGLLLASGAEARADGEGLFVALESPMPVGSKVIVRSPDGERAGRVAQVNEGTGPGVVIEFNGAAKSAPASAPAIATPTTPSSAAPVEETKNGESGDDEPDPKKTGRQRKKTRKTVMGH